MGRIPNIKNRSSYILKVTNDDDKIFICNRNSDAFNKLYEDRILTWMELHYYESMTMDDYRADIEVLEVFENLSNSFLKDQKFLNSMKQKWIKKFGAQIEKTDEDKTMCNKSLNTFIENIRAKWNIVFNDIRNTVDGMDDDEIYSILKTLWYDKIPNTRNKADILTYRFEYTYEDFRAKAGLSKEEAYILAIFKQYFINRYKEGKKRPFDDAPAYEIKKFIRSFIDTALNKGKIYRMYKKQLERHNG